MDDDPEERELKIEYKKNIVNLLNYCGDLFILDIILRLLQKCK